MNDGRISGGTLCCAAAVLALGLLAPPWSDAQVISLDQSIGPELERSDLLTEGVIDPKDEDSIKSFDQGSERPLTVPDRMMHGDDGRLLLRTPDQTDAVNVRESDEKTGATGLSF